MNKELIKAKIETAFDNFKVAIQKHTDINKKPVNGGWTVGEIANHIVKATSVDLGATKKKDIQHDQNEASIRDLFLNFEMKFPAASVLQPDSKSYSTGEIFSSLDDNKESILTMISSDDLTETCVDLHLPVWGHLTKYEWLVLFENHIIRHTKQVNDLSTISA